ncbi:MAG: DUF3179 domain-containing (seleno)protein [Candidatus Binatia bacterium]
METLVAVFLILISGVACLTQSMPVLKIGPPPVELSYATFRYRPVFALVAAALALWLGGRWLFGGMTGAVAPAALGLAGLIWASLAVSPSHMFHPQSGGRALSAAEADMVPDSATVVGVVVGGEARAYPAEMTQPHHIVPDVLGGERILASWCPLCHSGMVFKGDFKGRRLAPRVIGGGNNNVLFYDPRTKNLIQQMNGEIVAGPDRGEHLEWIPAVTTSWSNWRREQPATTVWWSPPGTLFRRLVRTLAMWAPTTIERKQKPFYAMSGTGDDRRPFSEKVSAVQVGTERRAYPASALAQHAVVNDIVGGVPIAVFAASSASFVRFFDRRVKEGTLTFRVENQEIGNGTVARDQETGSGWTLSGTAVDGPLRGLKLQQIAGVNRVFWGAYAFFFPGATLWDGPAQEDDSHAE